MFVVFALNLDCQMMDVSVKKEKKKVWLKMMKLKF